jgi:hypothetical protein
MEHYPSYFLNAASRIIAMATFESANAQAALAETHRHLVDHECRVAAELWHEADYIGWVERGDGQKDVPVVANRAAHRLAKCPLLLKAS